MIRVAHVVTSLEVGGAQIMLKKLIENRNQAAIEPLVISLMSDRGIGERLKSIGIEVFALDSPRTLPTWRAFLNLRALARKLDVDIVQGWMYHGNIAAWIFKLFSRGKPKLILGVRQALSSLSDEKPLTRLAICVNVPLSFRALVIYNAFRAKAHHEALGFSRRSANVIPNGIDTKTFAPAEESRLRVRRSLGIGDDALVIGLVCRFHPMKDHASFINAAAVVARELPKTVFLLVGEGVTQSNAALVEQIRTLTIVGQVILAGLREDIPEVMSAIDIAVSSSVRNEGFSNSIAESMSCAIPCVVTDVGDSALIVGKTGLVVPPGDPQRLGQAILNIANKPLQERLGLGQSARQRVIENYSIASVTAQFETQYLELLRGSNV